MSKLNSGRSGSWRNQQSASPRRAVIESLEGRRLLSASDLDGTFGTAGKSTNTPFGRLDFAVLTQVTQPDGKTLVGGRTFGATENAALARFLPNGQLDTTFGSGGTVWFPSLAWSSGAEHVIVNDDGTITATGSTGAATGPVVQRFTSTGAIDPTWVGPGSYITADPAGVVKLAGGKSLLGVNGLIYRLNANGAIDTSFGTNGNMALPKWSTGDTFTLRAMAESSDGKIIIGGDVYTSSNSHRQAAVLRLLGTGLPDASFGTYNGISEVPTVSTSGAFVSYVNVGSDGTIWGTGTDYLASGTAGHTASASMIVRVSSMGAASNLDDVLTSDTVFGKVAIAADGSAAVSGNHQSSLPVVPFLVDFNADGTLNTSFGPTGNGQSQPLVPTGYQEFLTATVTAAPDGGFLVSNAAGQDVDHGYDLAFRRVAANGVIDTSFGTDGYNDTPITGPLPLAVFKTLLQPDGKLLVAGANPYTATDAFIERLNADGSLDTTFGKGGTAYVDLGGFGDAPHGLTLQPDGKILVVGQSDGNIPTSNKSIYALARLNSDGSLDGSFGTNGVWRASFVATNETLYGATVGPQGDIYAVGIENDSGTNSLAIFRFDSSGNPDTSFGANGDRLLTLPGTSSPTVRQVVATPDGGFIVGGTDYTSSGSNTNRYIAKFLPSGALDPNFATAGILTLDSGDKSEGLAAILADKPADPLSGNLYVVGTTTGSATSLTIIRVALATGTVDTTYATAGTAKLALASGASINDATFSPQGGLLVAGSEPRAGAPSSSDTDFLVLAITPGGAYDATFGSGGTALVDLATYKPTSTAFTEDVAYGISLTPTDKILIAGRSIDEVTGNGSFAAAELVGPLNITAAAGAVYAVSGQPSAPVLTVSAGSVTLNADLGAVLTSPSIHVASGATLSLASSQHLASLSVGGTAKVAGSAALTLTGPLSIGSAGSLDIASGSLTLNAAAQSLASVRADLRAAYDNGKWDGVGGITSSYAAATPGVAIGYATAGEPATPAVGTGQILLKPALIGDANLDGKVNGLDTRQIYTGGAFNDLQNTHDWSAGDVTYDGYVNGLDTRAIYTSGTFNNPTQTLAGVASTPEPVAPVTTLPTPIIARVALPAVAAQQVAHAAVTPATAPTSLKPRLAPLRRVAVQRRRATAARSQV